MCGIAGYSLITVSRNTDRLINTLMNSIRERGPDDEGVCLVERPTRRSALYRTDKTEAVVWRGLPHVSDSGARIPHDLAFLHTRYAIVDLSPGGHQPFVSQDGTIIAIYNGEIYNYPEIRAELTASGVGLRTSCDTEVLIEGYRIWGNDVWSKLNGFWAVALYDRDQDALVLCRDRIGVAPLYYRETDKGLFFASAIRGLAAIDPDGVELDTERLLGFAQTGIKDSDNSTVYRQIRSIPPATAVTFKAGCLRLEDATSRPYWSFPSARWSVGDLSLSEAAGCLRDTLIDAVSIRLRADVKVAFELSGGLDSSSIVAIAAMLRNNDITTYTIRVPERDEEPYARAILERYPVDYHVLTDPENDFLGEWEDFTVRMEEPYHSPNIYTHYKMRQRMKHSGAGVVVAGAGGDEVLAGYEWTFWPKARCELRRSGQGWEALRYDWSRKFMTRERAGAFLWNAASRLRGRLSRLRGVAPLENGSPAVPTCTGGMTRALTQQTEYQHLGLHESMLYHFKVALIPYYLRSNDHFTMAIPVEHRFPFLDYRVVELGLRFPAAYLFKDGWTKYLLRKAMEPHLPKKIVWRPEKMGFPFAITPFLQRYRSYFEPKLSGLAELGLPGDAFGSYEFLLDQNPNCLWRLCSIALFLQCLASRGARPDTSR